MSRALLLPFIVISSLASAAPPSTSGSPRYTLDPPGPALVGEGGDIGLKLRVEEGPARAVLLDVRTGAPADAIVAELRLEAWRDGAQTEVPVSALAFGVDSAVARLGDVQVGMAAGTLGGFVISVQPDDGESTEVDALRIILEAPSAEGRDDGTLVLADGRALALHLGGADGHTTEGGDGYVQLTAGLERFVDARLAIGTGLSEAAARSSASGTAPLVPHDAADLLLDEPMRTLFESAMAQLRANEVPTGGFVAHRGDRNLHWTWESAWQSWAMALLHPERGLAGVEAHRRGQVQTVGHVEHGLRYARVDAEGRAPPLNAGPGTTEHFTRAAPWGFVLRALADERAVLGDDRLRPLVDFSLDAFDWSARRRDRDEDFRYELNGAIEHPEGDSPRFTAFWSPQDAQHPLVEGGAGRIALNAVDVNAWLAHETLEAWRLAAELGHPRADDARNRGLPLAARVLHPDEGHWSAQDGAWFDYVRRGANRDRDFGQRLRTPASWSPLAAGLVREGGQIRDGVTRHALDPLLFTANGIPTHVGGPVSPMESFLTLVTLSRYGWEAEAQVLRERLFALLSRHPNLHALYTPDGEPLGSGGEGAAAAVAILLALHADEAEVFAMQEGHPAAARTGHFRRLFRASDGRVAWEVRSYDGPRLPKTTLSAESQLFSDEPMTLTIDRGSARIALPLFAEVELIRRSRSRAGEVPGEKREPLKGPDEEGVSFELTSTEEVELRVLRFSGERGAGCGCTGSGGGGGGWLLLGIVVAVAFRRRRFAPAVVAFTLLGAVTAEARPRLAVILVVDQLGESHLQRRIDEGLAPTIARLTREGFRFHDARYEAAPALTAAGHATIATGAYPELHGIVANDWYEPRQGRFVGSVEDPRFTILGREPVEGDGTAASALRSSTLGEALKIRYPLARVVGVAGKDRSAILSAGPAADLALWLDPEAPRFTTSTAYTRELPAFVAAVNDRLREELRKGFVWELPRGGITGKNKAPDWVRDRHGFGKSFPHRIDAAGKPSNISEQLLHLPMTEALVVDLALRATDALELGRDDQPDLLTVSFSTFDKVLHTFGPDSAQAAEAMRIVDGEIRRLLEGLDAKVGKGRYTVALTSDHGGGWVAEVVRERRVRAGQLDTPALQKILEAEAQKSLGRGPWLAGFKGTGWYIAPEREARMTSVLPSLRARLLQVEGVRDVFTQQSLLASAQPTPVEALYRRGLYPPRSPELFVAPDPFFTFGPKDVTGHGTWHLYDRHVPLILWGSGIRKGEGERAELTDLAPTLSRLLGTAPPSGAQGRVLREALLP